MNEVEELLDGTVTLMPSGAELRARAARRRHRRLAGAGAAVAVAAVVAVLSVVPEGGSGESRPAGPAPATSTDGGRPSTPYRIGEDIQLLETDVLPDAERAKWKTRMGLWTSGSLANITDLSLDLRCQGPDSGPGLDRERREYSSENVSEDGSAAMQRYADYDDPADARSDHARLQKALTSCGLTKVGSGAAAGYKDQVASEGYTGVDANGREVTVMLHHAADWLFLAEVQRPLPE